MDDGVEKLAIRAALGNNGGEWAEHYTEAQKEHWRQWVRDLAVGVATEANELGRPNDAAIGWKAAVSALEGTFRKIKADCERTCLGEWEQRKLVTRIYGMACKVVR